MFIPYGIMRNTKLRYHVSDETVVRNLIRKQCLRLKNLYSRDKSVTLWSDELCETAHVILSNKIVSVHIANSIISDMHTCEQKLIQLDASTRKMVLNLLHFIDFLLTTSEDDDTYSDGVDNVLIEYKQCDISALHKLISICNDIETKVSRANNNTFLHAVCREALKLAKEDNEYPCSSMLLRARLEATCDKLGRHIAKSAK